KRGSASCGNARVDDEARSWPPEGTLGHCSPLEGARQSTALLDDSLLVHRDSFLPSRICRKTRCPALLEDRWAVAGSAVAEPPMTAEHQSHASVVERMRLREEARAAKVRIGRWI